MGNKIKTLHYLSAKGNNKRITVGLIEYNDGKKAFRVVTKTLVNLKERQITETDNLYSVETFAVLAAMFDRLLENHQIKNKILLKELSNIKPFKGSGTL